MSALPTTLSGLLRIAVEDAQKVEKLPGYILDMGEWHQPRGGVCAVCMAGAVMALRLGADPEKFLGPGDLGVGGPMNAIDSMRLGDFAGAWYALHRAVPPQGRRQLLSDASDLVEWGLPDEDTYRGSWSTYLEAADLLAAGGL